MKAKNEGDAEDTGNMEIKEQKVSNDQVSVLVQNLSSARGDNERQNFYGQNIGTFVSLILSPLEQIQLPSPTYTVSSQGSFNSNNIGSEMIDKLFGLMGDINGQLLTLRQQQATSMNSLNSLTNDVAHLEEEVKKIRGGTNSRGGRGGRGQRGKRGRRV